MSKSDVYQKELNKLNKIFQDVEESKRKLVEGLVEDAAFLKAENFALRETISITGMVKVHPAHPELQKAIPAAKEYRQNVNSYSTVIKALNGVLSKGIVEDEDDLSEFE